MHRLSLTLPQSPQWQTASRLQPRSTMACERIRFEDSRLLSLREPDESWTLRLIAFLLLALWKQLRCDHLGSKNERQNETNDDDRPVDPVVPILVGELVAQQFPIVKQKLQEDDG